MTFAVVVFPGSNCDHDAYHAVKHVLGADAVFVWHKEASLGGADVVLLPGGFSHGDYLRTGAIARFSPIMRAVADAAASGAPVLGVCNGFQVLLECGLLPGAMLRNRDLKFQCRFVDVRVERTDTPFTGLARAGQVLRMPIAHGEGNYWAPPDTIDEIEAAGRVVFRYSTPAGEVTDEANPNGSVNGIAGICNADRNVVGLMPHPERACEAAVGSDDGLVMFRSVLDALADRGALAVLEMSDPAEGQQMTIDPAVLERHGVTPDEYQRIVGFLGREPNLTELGLFSVMWSEHCSYKSSRVHLRTLPTEGARVLQGPGENAGAVDIGDGLAAVFKIESHNHPSFIEPYQGAATGVGGIIRDIFTMGARPIALLNSLRFGAIDQPGTRRLVKGVVSGIGGYGNSIGIPTVGGEVMFDELYAGNPLVNVFCLGIARHDAIVKGAATGIGNPLYYVGARTGRDGIHGATMASAEFDDRSAEKRPAVQVGDPFMEKLLLEACLEVMKTDAVVGVQDMGAAGLTCSTCETGSRGGVGVEIDVAHVPQREQGMTPYEIMLSESQERMLLIVKRGREQEVEAIFAKWDLHAVRIGEVTEGDRLRIRSAGELVADVPNRALTDEAPVYHRPFAEPAGRDELRRIPAEALGPIAPVADVFMTLLASPTVASKRWIYEQYDHMVRTNTIAGAGTSAGVVRVKGTGRALAMSADGNGRFCLLDPRRGARLAVAEAARNVACTGARPIGATNCLNFGNPERPAIMWQFAEAVAGIGEACTALGTPITGGNVSLYNETDGQAILPTPVIGVVGLIEDASTVRTRMFPAPDLEIVLFGDNLGELGGSEYLKTMHRLIRGVPPVLDLDRERALQALLVEQIAAGRIVSAHDCAEGGVAVTLAECCFDTGGVGADVSLPAATSDGGVDARIATLFGESASRVVAAVPPAHLAALLEAARAAGVPAERIGRTGGDRLVIAIGGTPALDCAVAEAETRWRTSLSDWMEGKTR